MRGATLRRITAVVALAGLGALAGCANTNASALVHQACGHVNDSLSLYERSLTEPQPSATTDQNQALAQLRDAMPIAATAAGEAPEWQALMATLAESSRGVPESYLVGALRQQCATTILPGAPNTPLTTVPM